MYRAGINRRDFLRSASLLAFSGLASLDSVMAQKGDPVIAETVFGKVKGIEKQGIKVFKGIPYGASTAGANRFMPAADPDNWTGVRDALAYGHSAPQSIPPGDPANSSQILQSVAVAAKLPGPSIYSALEVPGNKQTGEGEDCLVLNVWTPALNDGRKRAVMLWLHGGGFGSGSGSNVGWDGTNLCLRGNVVVITINHRLNVMGFADFSTFSDDFTSSGNAGMLDIVQALKWVQNNISHFGGDPGNVMIFGQSGGGRKCETLLAMPAAKGLFHRAVIESGVAIKVTDKAIAAKNAEALLNKLGIRKQNVHDIQKLPLADIMKAYFALGRELNKISPNNAGFSPSAGGNVLPQHPVYPTASAISADVPVIIGCTRTEATGLTTDARLWHLEEGSLRERVSIFLGDQTEKMIKLYRRIYPGASPSDLYFLINSDYYYCAPTVKIAERRATLGKGPVFAYYFAWETPVQDGQLKSPHNIEWPFAFDNVLLCARLTGGGPEAIALADKISDAWIAFAYTGNPNTPKLPHWPAFTVNNHETMVINNECTVVNDPLKEQRIAMYKALDLT